MNPIDLCVYTQDKSSLLSNISLVLASCHELNKKSIYVLTQSKFILATRPLSVISFAQCLRGTDDEMYQM